MEMDLHGCRRPLYVWDSCQLLSQLSATGDRLRRAWPAGNFIHALVVAGLGKGGSSARGSDRKDARKRPRPRPVPDEQRAEGLELGVDCLRRGRSFGGHLRSYSALKREGSLKDG